MSPLSPDSPHLQCVIKVTPDKFIITPGQIEDRLARMKVNKASGPDHIPAWILRDFAPCLASPLSAIFNASIREGHVPELWKTAFTVPIPKVYPPKDLKTDLRPISLTPIISKVLEHFICAWMDESIDKRDPQQYGGFKGSSTTRALVDIMDYLYRSTDATGKHARLLLCDFAKAFDLVNTNMVLDKLKLVGCPEIIVRWAAAFMLERKQQVKVGNIVSELVTLKGGNPQGTLIGPRTFVVHIGDLQCPGPVLVCKYIDDTSICHATDDVNDQTMQEAASYVQSWAENNDMRLNKQKTKELVISFKKDELPLGYITIDGCIIDRVHDAKLLGITISDDLTWASHVLAITSKANKRVFMLHQLKRSGVGIEDLKCIYCSVIRPLLEYACPVWHSSITKLQSQDIENIQKRVLRTIYGWKSYEVLLQEAGLPMLNERRYTLCKNYFRECMEFHTKLLPCKRLINHDLRTINPYPVPKCRTSRYQNSFIPWALRYLQ